MSSGRGGVSTGMRTLAITQNMTVDGVIDLSDDWFSPAAGDDQTDLLEA